jgi:hypothetical protein
MGLPQPALRFLALEHKRRPFCGSVLTLGRQAVFAWTTVSTNSVPRYSTTTTTPINSAMFVSIWVTTNT